jgi:rRNA-processing protein EBP2
MPVISKVRGKQADDDVSEGTAESRGSSYFEEEEAHESVAEEGSDRESNDANEAEEADVVFREPQAWVERLALTAALPLPRELNVDDDPKREEVFLQHAMISARKGVALLDAAKIPWRRPLDYFAEMFKSDVHMEKVRESIVKAKKAIEARAARRASKDQKRFGKEVQAEALRQKARAKRDQADRIATWRRKRGRTGDDEEELEEAVGGSTPRAKRHLPGQKSLRPGGKKRPGKSKRQR